MKPYYEDEFKEIDLAYISGLIDGEGYIGIIPKKPSKANGTVNITFKERIQIRMINEEAIKFISEIFNVPYFKENRPYNKSGKPLYCISVSDLNAIEILKILLPYLKVKKRISEKVLEFREFRKNPEKIPVEKVIKNRWGKDIKVIRYRHSPEYIEKCMDFIRECKNIIHGVSDE